MQDHYQETVLGEKEADKDSLKVVSLNLGWHRIGGVSHLILCFLGKDCKLHE